MHSLYCLANPRQPEPDKKQILNSSFLIKEENRGILEKVLKILRSTILYRTLRKASKSQEKIFKLDSSFPLTIDKIQGGYERIFREKLGDECQNIANAIRHYDGKGHQTQNNENRGASAAVVPHRFFGSQPYTELDTASANHPTDWIISECRG